MPYTEDEISKAGVVVASTVKKLRANGLRELVQVGVNCFWGAHPVDLESNWDILHAFLECFPNQTPGLHVIAAVLVMGDQSSDGQILSVEGGEDLEVLALKYSGRIRMLMRYVRVLTHKSRKAKKDARRIQLLKDLIRIKPYKWTPKRVEAAKRRKVLCLHNVCGGHFACGGRC